MTGLFLIAISPDGQRTFFGSRGVSAHLRLTDTLEACLDKIKDEDGVAALQVAGYAFLSENSRQCAGQLIRHAKQRGIWTAIDLGLGPSRQIPAVVMQMLPDVETVFANGAEAEALSGKSNPEAALVALEQAGAHEVVLKLGAEGCLIRSRNDLRRVPAFAVSVVDTTGAGDAFIAGFIAGRTWGWTTEECAILANACGAAASATMGAGQNLPSMSAVQHVLDASRMGTWEPVRARVAERLKSRISEPQSRRVAHP